jgi:hypothetical protein
MAGEINLQPFIDQLFGGAPSPAVTGQPSARPPDWQQSLTESVDPEVQKKERIRNFLANFGQALSSTPGNFVQGLAAGAGKGATIYNDERSADTQKRTAAQKLIAEFQQSQDDRGFERAKDQLNIGRTLKSDKQSDEDRIYNRGRQKSLDKQAERRMDIAEKRLDKELGGKSLTPGQEIEALQHIDKAVEEFASSLDPGATDQEEEANLSKIEEFRQKQYARYGFDEDGQYVGRQPATKPGIINPDIGNNSQGQPGGSVAPSTKIIGGKTYIKKADGWYEQ